MRKKLPAFRKHSRHAVLLFGACLALAACTSNPTTPLNLQWQPESQAKIITQNGVQERCIAPVSVYEINDQTTSVSQQGFYLEAGHYRIKAQGLVSTFGCPVLYIPKHYRIPPIEATFEAGKVYYLGMDHSSTRITDWRVVIWRVEGESGEEAPVPVDGQRVAQSDGALTSGAP